MYYRSASMSAETHDSRNMTEQNFLNELKSQFDHHIDLRKSLDSKATTMITIASSIITLNIAIATFLITKIEQKDLYYSVSILILTIGVLLALISILKFIRSYSVRSYGYPMGHEHFFKNGEYKEDLVDRIRNLSEKDSNDTLFRGYFTCIRTAKENNDSKANGIKIGHLFLITGLIAIAVVVGFVLVSTALGHIKLLF
jgi:hypothetical protein